MSEPKREVTGEKVGENGSTDAFAASQCVETQKFMEELAEICRRHGLALVPQYEYEVSFHDPMRVVPLTPEIAHEINESLVCFKK